MLIPFDQQVESARIWVYQANRTITEIETIQITEYLNAAIANWAAHGAGLLASFKITYGRFVVVAVDEQFNAASGCSIDASTHWFKNLGQELSIDFFDRSVAFIDSLGQIQTTQLPLLKSLIETHQVTKDTTVFNNLVKTIGEYKTSWKVPAAQSWMNRYFNTAGVSTVE